MRTFNIHGHVLGFTYGNSWDPDTVAKWRAEGRKFVDVCRPTTWLYVDGHWISTSKAPDIISYALLAESEFELIEYLNSEGVYESEVIRMAEKGILPEQS